MRRGAFAAGICAAILAFLSIVYFGVIGNLALVVLISAPMMFASVFALSYLKLKGLNDNGQRLAGQVVGLKRYMEDFSDFRDRGVADLTLWGSLHGVRHRVRHFRKGDEAAAQGVPAACRPELA